ncbi:hypothetical protein QOZ98_001603 [Planomicrobium stackebrandtii]|uniref:Uncharacterized protein n=1 Tax=Planomicrobium stackebrandtii TaxID=253160 RepID=A0ABU0GTU1_9BACL|nr:hypothetical protein [Planomicrobium stackebrandtii]
MKKKKIVFTSIAYAAAMAIVALGGPNVLPPI